MPPKRRQRTEEELRQAVIHVRYTIDQLTAAMYWELLGENLELKDGRKLGIQKVILKNACLESSLVSLRILNDFFKPRQNYPDDLVALDFLKKGDSLEELGLKSFLSTDIEEKLNKHLAHLTWERVKTPSPPWDYAVIYSSLPTCRKFLDYVRKTLLCESEQEYKKFSQLIESIELFQTFLKTGQYPK